MRRTLLAVIASSVAVGAAAQPTVPRVDELIATRIAADRSNVCVQAARIDLDALPTVVIGTGCASARNDAPAPDARFEIGSISKGLVGLLAAEMVARGELRFDEPLQALLPKEVTVPAFEGQPILLADLLTHTAGLPALPLLFRPASGADPYADLQPAVVYGSLAKLKLASAPGSRYAYSNWAFLMLSDLLAQRAGQPFDQLLTERVLRPLGMHDTLVARNERLVRGRMANGQPASTWNVPVAYAGAGGVRSTLDDIIKLARALLGDVPEGTPDSLRRALVDAPKALRAAYPRIDVGAAWHTVKRDDGVRLTYHSGMTAGFSASLVFDRTARRAGVVLADAAGGFEDLAVRLVDGKQLLAVPAKPVSLDRAAAAHAVGRYELRPGFVLTLSMDGERLFAQATGQGRFELLQDARGDYYTLVADLLIRMQRASTGQATGLTLYQGGGAMPAKRLVD